jgi:hypothetical protein
MLAGRFDERIGIDEGMGEDAAATAAATEFANDCCIFQSQILNCVTLHRLRFSSLSQTKPEKLLLQLTFCRPVATTFRFNPKLQSLPFMEKRFLALACNCQILSPDSNLKE